MGKLDKATFLQGDAKTELRSLDEGSARTCITSPPYWGLRDYGTEDQIGLEEEVDAYVNNLCDILDEVGRVLTDDGTLWLNIGDSYAGSGKGPGGNINKEHHHMEDKSGGLVPDGMKPKDLVGIPWEVAFELRSRGWYLRSDIIWKKPDPMPESVKDRPTNQHEYLFLLSKSRDYFYDHDAIKEDAKHADDRRHGEGRIGYNGKRQGDEGTGQEAFVSIKDRRNKRSVWDVTTAQVSEAHFAVFPLELVEPCVLAGSEEGDMVLDPFAGSGTTGIAALKHGRKFVGVDLNKEYIQIAKDRIRGHNEVPVNHGFWS